MQLSFKAKTIFGFVFVLSVLSTPPAFAEEKKELPPAVDINAKDVWDVDIFRREDHKVLVIQERRYTKAKRFELGVHAGLTKGSPFYNSVTYGVHGDYYFTEYLGIDLFYNQSNSTLTADANQIDEFLDASGFSSRKEYQRPDKFGGVALLWAPIYGKFAVFRSTIVHFDFFGSVGFSLLTSKSNRTQPQTDSALDQTGGGKDQTHKGSLLSLGTRVFLSENLSLRIDVRHNAYKSFFAGTTGDSVNIASTELWRQNFQFTLGTSVIF